MSEDSESSCTLPVWSRFWHSSLSFFNCSGPRWAYAERLGWFFCSSFSLCLFGDWLWMKSSNQENVSGSCYESNRFSGRSMLSISSQSSWLLSSHSSNQGRFSRIWCRRQTKEQNYQLRLFSYFHKPKLLKLIS